MDNSQAAYEYYLSQGLEPHQAAGIVGNLQGESGRNLDPYAISKGDGRDGSDSIGIAQWNGTRAQALKEYAASKGVPWTDLNIQLDFLHQELKGSEKSAYQRLIAAQTPEEASRAMLAYERPKDWNKPGSYGDRARYAAATFAKYGGGGAPTQPSAPLSLAPPQPNQPPPAPPLNAQATPPIFAGASRGGVGAMPAQEVAQAAPIFFAPRRAPNLSKLQAALAPVSRGFLVNRG
ncbi:hypothetical protein E4K64_39405 [Bradyrhizobium frederickii]|uniref:Phage tail lysozyme domain-containing protein n=1 Tax=Bradyrhizobium frederickii TaxID=2560054 RepID=A0A4Y9NFA9_9BRAD|nr:phage tail tip lysozyme [Bradyrhizobium frederickii]TFV66459.1 hypothetical protein E4K64_39405 [Bradyrhizobium frederickii]